MSFQVEFVSVKDVRLLAGGGLSQPTEAMLLYMLRSEAVFKPPERVEASKQLMVNEFIYCLSEWQDLIHCRHPSDILQSCYDDDEERGYYLVQVAKGILTDLTRADIYMLYQPLDDTQVATDSSELKNRSLLH